MTDIYCSWAFCQVSSYEICLILTSCSFWHAIDSVQASGCSPKKLQASFCVIKTTTLCSWVELCCNQLFPHRGWQWLSHCRFFASRVWVRSLQAWFCVREKAEKAQTYIHMQISCTLVRQSALAQRSAAKALSPPISDLRSLIPALRSKISELRSWI